MAKNLKDIVSKNAGRNVPKGEEDFLATHTYADQGDVNKNKNVFTAGNVKPEAKVQKNDPGKRHGYRSVEAAAAAYEEKEIDEASKSKQQKKKSSMGSEDDRNVDAKDYGYSAGPVTEMDGTETPAQLRWYQNTPRKPDGVYTQTMSGVLPAHPSPTQGGGVSTQPEAPQNQPGWISPRQEWLNKGKPKGRSPVAEAKCNMTAENVNCPVHGLKECWKEDTYYHNKELGEREMSDAEMKKREDIVKGMKKNIAGFKQRYGERAKDVMYATATKKAMDK